MIIGVLSDTHSDRNNALPHIIKEFKERGVELIVHGGDIIKEHLDPELFGNLPVVCALVEGQVDKEAFQNAPANWKFTYPGDRIYTPEDKYWKMYIGHKMSFEFLTNSGNRLAEKLNKITTENDDVRWLISGHTHHQIYKQCHLINFLNPGAVEDSFDGYEFAIINTDNGETVFGRIPKTKPIKSTFSVGVISDSFDISEMDPDFWKKLAEEFRKRDVKHIIHCGNISLKDIGHTDLKGFEVHYYLRKDQDINKVEDYDGWHQIPIKCPVVDFDGYKFCIQFNLGADLMEQSEIGMHKICTGLRKEYPEISFVLCGLTNDAFLEEDQHVKIVNPGDILRDRNFAVICLPRTEITFGHVPVDPLPPLK